MPKLALIVTLVAVATIAPAAAASPTVRMTIVHFFQGCHVWGTNLGQPLGPTRRISLTHGSKLVIRVNCPMSFNFQQVPGPKLALGAPRTYAGTTRTIVFRKVGLQTLGPDNRLVLIVRVK